MNKTSYNRLPAFLENFKGFISDDIEEYCRLFYVKGFSSYVSESMFINLISNRKNIKFCATQTAFCFFLHCLETFFSFGNQSDRL